MLFRSVGLSLFTLQVTHKIDEHTDIERDYVVASIRQAVPQTRIVLIRDFATGYHSRNGGGDTIQTDGDLPVIDLRAMPLPGGPGAPAVAADEAPGQAGTVIELTGLS